MARTYPPPGAQNVRQPVWEAAVRRYEDAHEAVGRCAGLRDLSCPRIGNGNGRGYHRCLAQSQEAHVWTFRSPAPLALAVVSILFSGCSGGASGAESTQAKQEAAHAQARMDTIKQQQDTHASLSAQMKALKDEAVKAGTTRAAAAKAAATKAAATKAAATKRAKPDVSALIGKWSVHGMQITINANGTAVSIANFGPCGPPEVDMMSWPMCTQTTSSSWVADGPGRILETVRSVKVRRDDTGQAVGRSQATPSFRVGDEFSFRFVRRGLAMETPLKGSLPSSRGNNWRCNSQTSHTDQILCGA